MKYDLVVVGGGILGLATAYQFLRDRPGAGVLLLEKEQLVAMHQSGRNSGVLHAGLYYRPGSSKARMAREGIREMTQFCQEHGIAHEICGKLVVATSEDETSRLRDLFDRGTANGLRGLRWLEIDQAREIEPHVGGLAAVHVPEEGIVDFPGVCRALLSEIGRMGGEVVTGSTVQRIEFATSNWEVETGRSAYTARAIVNCAGLHADRVAKLAGEEPEIQIVPFRGEYFLLRPDRHHLVRNLIYPVPDPAFPFLGVHLTRRCLGGIEAGPNAVFALAREGYTRATVNGRDMLEALGFPGLWRFLLRYRGASWDELRRSISKTLFTRSLQRLVPEIEPSDLENRPEGGAGVRAQAMQRDGKLVEDFALVSRPGAVHVLNAPSPAATASLVIGRRIVSELHGDPSLSPGR